MLPTTAVIGHKEWAVGRKSDPTYDMNWRRNRVANFTPVEDDMYDAGDRRKLDALLNAILGDWNPAKTEDGRRPLPGSVAASVGVLLARDPADVDEAELAAQLAPLLVDRLPALGDDDLTRLATAVNDERDRRARDNDPTTGPTS